MSTIISDMVSHLQCGVAIAANDAVYINSADGKIYKYDPLQPLQVYAGIAKEAGLLNAFIRVVQSGRVKGFSGLTPGAFVYASVTVPGGFQLTDPGSSLKVVLGIAKSVTELTVNGALGIKTGGGTGSGGINYILNPDADTTVGWATYADAGGVTPVDGTGGSPTVTLTRSTSSPLRGTASFLYTKPASNVQGQGFSYDFTIDPADCGKVLQGSFDYQIASGVFVDDAITVWIYDITNSRLIQPAPTKLKNSGIIERFPFEFQTSIDSTSYRLIVHQSSTSAVASTIKFDNFKVGPTAKLYGSVVTDWVSYTPVVTGLGAGSGTPLGKWRRVGDSAEIQVRFTKDATPGSGTAAVIFTIPSGLTIDTNKINSTMDQVFGYGQTLSVEGLYAFHPILPSYASTTTIYLINNGTSNPYNGSDFVANSKADFTILLPIQGWSSSQIMSSDADTRVVAMNVVKSSLVVASSGTPLLFGVAQFDKNGMYDSATSITTIKTPGTYRISTSPIFSVGATSTGSYLNLGLYINNVQSAHKTFRAITGSITQTFDAFFLVDLKAGDTVSVGIVGTIMSLTSSTEPSYLSIERLSGPSQIAASSIVSFSANTSTTTATTSTPFIYTIKDHDTHNAYSTVTGKFTAPMAGNYFFTATDFAGATVFTPSLYKNNAIVQVGSSTVASAAPGVVSYTLALLTGDTVEVRPSTSATASGGATGNNFSGFRIGGVV